MSPAALPLHRFEDYVAAVPSNLDAEKAVLGAILIDASLFRRVAEILRPAQFFRRAHGDIFLAMGDLHRKGVAIDPITVAEELRRSGGADGIDERSYLASLTDGVPRAMHVEHYARTVRDLAAARQGIAQLDRARDAVAAGRPDRARVLLDEFQEDASATDDILLEPVAQVAQRVSVTPPTPLITGLLPAGGITLIFGAPRTLKSIATRAIAVAVAGGVPAFCLPRLTVHAPAPVAYVTEEDRAEAVIAHLDVFSGGAASRGELALYLSACRGVSLDDPVTQARVIRDARLCGAKLIVLEPARSLTACVDQGPRELQPFTKFLRRLIRETEAAILLGHHELKQGAGPDGRRGVHRISGGGLFSIADAPIHVERLDDGRALLTPTAWKHAASPPAIALTLETVGGLVTGVRAGEYARTLEDAIPPATTDRVLAVVCASPGSSSSEVAVRVGGRKQVAISALYAAERDGRLRSTQDGRCTRWYTGESRGAKA